MDAGISESITDAAENIRSSVETFTDELEGSLEKISWCGVYLTRRVTLSIIGILVVTAISIGVALGVTLSPSLPSGTTKVEDNIDLNVFKNLDHNYWTFGDVIESSIGKEIYDNATHEHETLLWLANNDPSNLHAATSPNNQILQRYVVANLYFSTNGTKWTDQLNFLSGLSVCGWNNGTNGVFCNDEGKVSNILLHDCNLVGSMPRDIGLLSRMENFNVSKNLLHGTIPVSFAMMSGLKRMDMSLNGLSGEIPPSIAMLLDLEVINLSSNKLNGADGAKAMKNLPFLKEIHLSHNFLSGNVGQLGTSESLRIVDLSFNSIQGSIPGNFGEGKTLQYLYFNNNELHGTIPNGIGNLNNLVKLDISNNKLSGSLPSTLGDLSMLQSLNLNSNNLRGVLPTELGYLSQLSMLQISGNGFTIIPKELLALKNLQTLSVSDNDLSGSLPTYIGLATSLVHLDLSKNKFSYQLPYEMSSLGIIEELYLNNNQFDGTIPSELSNLYLLKDMDVSNNNFYGDMTVIFCEGNRPEWGNQIESYKADCLNDNMSFSCATECCNSGKRCCTVPNEIDCKIGD